MPENPGTALPGTVIAKLKRYLAGNLDDCDPSAELVVSRLAGGRSNLTYLLYQGHPGDGNSGPGQQWVLRRPPLGHILPSAHDMAREFRTLSFLAGHQFPAPEPLALCSDESVLGVPFQILRYVPGLVISDELTSGRLTAGQAGRACRELIHTLARLHRIPPPALAPGRSASAAHYLRRQLARWTQQWQHTKTRDLLTFAQLARWLQEAVGRVPEDRQVTVVHGDYRLDNLVLDPATLDVRAVLDWEMSTLGDPLMDLAVLLVYWQQDGDALRRKVAVALGLTTASGFWSRDRLAAEYAQAAAVPVDGGQLNTCIALACLKLAVVMESVHYRHLSGQALDQLSSGLAGAAPALLEMGLRVAAGEGPAGLAA